VGKKVAQVLLVTIREFHIFCISLVIDPQTAVLTFDPIQQSSNQ